ncbi:MAG: putative transcriptional regulator [Planctomycetota bacterium]|jgi:predicted transcriptional regulator
MSFIGIRGHFLVAETKFTKVFVNSTKTFVYALSMANPKQLRNPTDAEMKILSVLWESGPLTVRGVFEFLSRVETIGQTTVLKLMQIMTAKGILERNTEVRPQVFWPAFSQDETQRSMLGDLVQRAFGGSPGVLTLQALSLGKTSPEELKQIRSLLDNLEAEQG